jgi:hypothetical protein
MADALTRDRNDNDAAQENREKRGGIKVFEWAREGCK